MRVEILAIGRLKDEAESAIVARYQKRFDQTGRGLGLGPLTIKDFAESRAQSVAQRKTDEADKLIAAAGRSVLIALEVTGRALTSEALAKHLKSLADSGAKSCALLIGGPDGHGPLVLERADLKLSLGAITLPHGLARAVLAEQLYRAATILSGHPYHRA